MLVFWSANGGVPFLWEPGKDRRGFQTSVSSLGTEALANLFSKTRFSGLSDGSDSEARETFSRKGLWGQRSLPD